jgi:hypothetical protein
MNEVFLQLWEQSDEDLGIIQDGCSLHIDESDLKKYLDGFYSNRNIENVPNQYDSAVGEPSKVWINDVLYAILQRDGFIRLEQYELNNLIGLKGIEI